MIRQKNLTVLDLVRKMDDGVDFEVQKRLCLALEFDHRADGEDARRVEKACEG